MASTMISISSLTFTYFLTDPNRGDQFEQKDRRWVAGLDARHTIFSQWFGRKVANTFGLQVRNDWIRNGLYQADDRVRVDKIDSSTDTTLPATPQADRFTDTQPGFYIENKIQWAEKFRSEAALRGDVEYFNVTSLVTPANTGTDNESVAQPEAKSDLRPHGSILSSIPRRGSAFTAMTDAVQLKRWNRFRQTIPTPILPSQESPL